MNRDPHRLLTSFAHPMFNDSGFLPVGTPMGYEGEPMNADEKYYLKMRLKYGPTLRRRDRVKWFMKILREKAQGLTAAPNSFHPNRPTRIHNTK